MDQRAVAHDQLVTTATENNYLMSIHWIESGNYYVNWVIRRSQLVSNTCTMTGIKVNSTLSMTNDFFYKTLFNMMIVDHLTPIDGANTSIINIVQEVILEVSMGQPISFISLYSLHQVKIIIFSLLAEVILYDICTTTPKYENCDKNMS